VGTFRNRSERGADVIDRHEIERIAALARLQLDDNEAAALARDCQRILEHFETIGELDLDSAESSDAAEGSASLREDRVDSVPLARRPEEMAPAWRDGYYVLPRLPAMDGGLPDEGDADEGTDG
jgi:aspartyl/glutamyl-tRNA(Asn/Gln) amidotransferase C subunit